MFIDPSRKHDFKSLLYTLLYLIKGRSVFGDLQVEFAPIKIRLQHQMMKRQEVETEAKSKGKTFATASYLRPHYILCLAWDLRIFK